MADSTQEPNHWDPTEESYLKSLAVKGVPPIVVGVLVLVAFLIFFVVRFCCLVCGKGCCPPRKGKNSKVATTLWVLVVAAPLFLALLGGALLTSAGPKVKDDMNGLADTLIEQIRLVRSDVAEVALAVQQALPEEFAADLSALDSADANLQEADDTIVGAEADVRGVFVRVEQAISGIGAAALVVAGVGALAALTRWPSIVAGLLVATCLVAPPAWIFAGVGMTVNAVVGDACTMMARHARGQPNPWLMEHLPCEEVAQAWDAAQEMMRASNNQTADANASIRSANDASPTVSLDLLCKPFVEAGGELAVNSAPDIGCVPLQPQRVQAAYEEYVCPAFVERTEDLQPDASNAACVVNGTPLKQRDYDAIAAAARAHVTISAAIPKIRMLSECGFVTRAFEAIVKNDCGALEGNSGTVGKAALLAGIGLTFAAFLFCACFGRFRRPKSSQVEEDGSPTHRPLIGGQTADSDQMFASL